MAAYVFNTSNVRTSGTAQTFLGLAGQDILAGRPVYLNTTLSQYLYANALISNAPAGVAVCSANTNQSVLICTRDTNFSPGIPVNVGNVVIVGNVAGQVNPVGDSGTGWGYLNILGVGIGGNNINFSMVGSNSNM